MKLIINVIAVTLMSVNTAWAWTPWAAGCSDFWGRAVPLESRTPDNCPNHFRSRVDSITNQGMSSAASYVGSNFIPPQSLPSTVLTPAGNLLIVPNYSTGGISAVLRTSTGK
jgi:hypothetical protein